MSNTATLLPDFAVPAARETERVPPLTPLPLISRLAEGLTAGNIRHCQWKGGRGTRWASGDGDLDLLVDRADAPQLANLLDWLGFKQALPPAEFQVPGVLHYLGRDEGSGTLVHLHLHYAVVIGPPWRTHYRLPLTRALLRSSVQGRLFPVPTPEHELILTVLRLMLAPTPAARTALARLEPEVRYAVLNDVLRGHLSEVHPDLFAACCDALRPGRSSWRRLAIRFRLAAALTAHARRPAVAAVVRGAASYVASLAGFPLRARQHLAGGGAVIALGGGDGAGKSTCALALEQWLAPALVVRRLHLGRPPRSLLTALVGGLLKAVRRLQQVPGGAVRRLAAHVELARYLCTARDRYLTYRGARRAAAAGALVLCDRHPVPENWAIVGPSAAQGVATLATGPLASWMRRVETRYCETIARPDVLCVLRVDPEVAVRRKVDEPEAYVRRRARLVWDTDWSRADAHVIDAGQSLNDVVAALQRVIWSAL